MSSNFITYEREGAVAIIGLNRPEKRNAINDDEVVQLGEAVERAGEEADAGVIFGHGVNFSAGLDLAQLLQRMEAPVPRKKGDHAWHTVFDMIARGKIPFVAALHGAVVGGGFELAAAAHIRVADRSAFFGLPEGQRGIFVGGGGSVRVQRIVGYSVMADLMLTGRILSIDEAERLNLVRYVVEEGQALAKAKELATRIAQNTPLTNWQITNVLPRVNDLSHDDGLFLEYINTVDAAAGEEIGCSGCATCSRSAQRPCRLQRTKRSVAAPGGSGRDGLLQDARADLEAAVCPAAQACRAPPRPRRCHR